MNDSEWISDRGFFELSDDTERVVARERVRIHGHKGLVDPGRRRVERSDSPAWAERWLREASTENLEIRPTEPITDHAELMSDDPEDPPVEVPRVDGPLEVVEAEPLQLRTMNATEIRPKVGRSVDLRAGLERTGHLGEHWISVDRVRGRHHREG